MNERSIEDRLRAVEETLSIFQTICGYGYAMDGCNASAVRQSYAVDGVYAVSDLRGFEGRGEIEALAASAAHLGLVRFSRVHMSAALT